jgi:hypothetical protein
MIRRMEVFNEVFLSHVHVACDSRCSRSPTQNGSGVSLLQSLRLKVLLRNRLGSGGEGT